MTPKLVQCLCPNRHVLAHAWVNPLIDDEFAIVIVRLLIQDTLQARPNSHCLCGALPDTWFCEVPTQYPNSQTSFDDIVSARGADIERKTAVWKRPEGMISVN